jgi:glycosyltransferase involved in cell wall biosynthesis
VNASAQAYAFDTSVIIPCYNRVNFLRRALVSVSKQRLSPTEVIVIDDGSISPLEKELGTEFPRTVWYRQENQGVSSARNLGIQKAHCPWVAFLDSDDEWQPEKLERQIRFHKSHPTILASHTDEVWIRNGNQVLPPKYLNKTPEELFKRSLERCLICPSSVLLHHSIFEKFGGFDNDLPVCEDYDLWLRVLLEESFGYIDEKLVVKHGGHSDQLSRQNWGMDRFRVRSLEKLVEKAGFSNSKQEAILSILVQKCKILAEGFRKHDKNKESELYFQQSLKYQNLLRTLNRV